MKWTLGLMLTAAFLLGVAAGNLQLEPKEEIETAKTLVQHALVQAEMAEKSADAEDAVRRMARAFHLAPKAAEQQLIEWDKESWLTGGIEVKRLIPVQNAINRRLGLPEEPDLSVYENHPTLGKHLPRLTPRGSSSED